MGKLQLIQTVKKHTGRVWNVSWHPKGDLFASCGEDKTIRLWSKDLLGKWGTKVVLVDGHKRTIRQISWSPCGNLLGKSPGNSEGVITVDNDPTWKCVCTISGQHSRTIYDIDWSPISGLLATACADNGLRIFQQDESSSDENSPTFNLVCNT